jgi:hypothetical protein
MRKYPKHTKTLNVIKKLPKCLYKLSMSHYHTHQDKKKDTKSEKKDTKTEDYANRLETLNINTSYTIR